MCSFRSIDEVTYSEEQRVLSLALEIECHFLLIMICSLNRYTDATSKYESVMKTEPSVSEYTIRSKERICHCFSKVTVDSLPEM